MDQDLISALRAFDRRERGLVVTWALDRIGFSLGYEFRSQLGDVLPKEPIACGPVSADAFAAMDYEMRWLHGAIAATIGAYEGPVAPVQTSDGELLPPLEWTNEDVDLLVAYSRGETIQLLMIEAKGYTTWDPKQLAHKVRRLRKLFGDDGTRIPNICPHLVFVGPVPPKEIPPRWPGWMLRDGKPVFIPLPQPTGQKYRLARKSASDDTWKIEPVRWPGA